MLVFNNNSIGTQLPRFLGSPGSLAVDALREVCYDSILQNAKTHSITIINSNQGSNFDPGLVVHCVQILKNVGVHWY